ncbi:hypothetical protein JCM3774_002261 [Rhodotorula dairenensis]
MASLPELPAVTALSKYVTRILGQNPSKFTLQGTNSYLVHHPHSTRMILIDTTGSSSSGPLPPAALSSYLASLRALLAGPGLGPEEASYISDIILTHWHRDHVDALAHVVRTLSRPVKVWKFPCAAAEHDECGGGGEWKWERGRDAALEQELVAAAAAATGGFPSSLAEGGSSPLPLVLEKSETGWIHVLRDGQTFRLEADRNRDQRAELPANGDGSGESGTEAVELEVVHTPGHTSDSICLILRAAEPPSSSSSSGRARAPLGLFTADTVLGHGTAVFASLAAYLSSLSRLVNVLEHPSASMSESTSTSTSAGIPVPLFPGHGDVVEDGVAKIREYRAHRLERENQVVQALKKAQQDGRGPIRADELVDQIYGSILPVALKPAATHGCLLHLAKLLDEGIVTRLRSVDGSTNTEAAVEHEELQIPEGWHDGWSLSA